MRNKVVAWMFALFASVGGMLGGELPVTDNLILRLDGSSVTLDGSSVTAWTNLVSGTGVSKEFVQVTASKRPALIDDAINGFAAVDFDGTDDFFENASDSAWNWNYDADPDDAARWTAFVVFQTDVSLPPPSNKRQHLLRSGYTDIKEGASSTSIEATWGLWLSENAYKVHGRSSDNAYVEALLGGKLETNGWHVFAGRLQNIVEPTITLNVDGQITTTTNLLTRQMNGHMRSRIGANTGSTPNEFFNGRIAEVLVYKDVLSDQDMTAVNRYLSDKYNLTDRFAEDLALHCRMDDAYARRGVTRPPPALSTADGDWTIKSTVEPVYNGTAKSSDPAGTVVSSVSGVIGEAINLSDATAGGRRVDFGDINALEPGTGSFSLALWFKPRLLSPTSGSIVLASHGNSGSGDTGWSIWFSGSNLNMRVCNGTADSNKAQLTYNGVVNGQWYHVVMVIDRTDNRLYAYVNGESDGLYVSYADWGDTFTSAAFGSSLPFLLGIRNNLNEYHFKGGIDDLAIWKRALTPNEVAMIYDLGLQGESFVPEPPPKGTFIRVR